MAKATGGGRATHTGTDYQNRCAGWFAVRILAERDVALPLELPAAVVLEGITCESGQPVDDIYLTTSAGGIVLGQAKHSLTLGTTAASDFASTLDQFVRQFLGARQRTPGCLPTGRDLDPSIDRLAILTSSESSSPITSDLAELLKRLRLTAPHRNTPPEPLDTAGSNAGEKTALKVTRQHVERSWMTAAGSAPTEADIGALLELVHVLVLDVDPEGRDERDAKTVLRQSVLKDPNQADTVWKAWIENQALLARAKAGLTRSGLQDLLAKDAVGLQAIRSYRADVAKLLAQTSDVLGRQARFSSIPLGSTTVKVTRPCVTHLATAVTTGSVLVIGEPGAGKSGVQYDAVRQLSSSGTDVVMLAAEGLAAGSLGQLRTELGLEHELVDVLRNWPGVTAGILVIDALDAARSEGIAGTLRDLIDSVSRDCPRWRIIASIRKYDLRYSSEVQKHFAGAPLSGYQDQEFRHVRHVNVPPLDDAELAQATSQSSELCALVEIASPALRELLYIPFNLSLVAALLESGLTKEEVSPIRTQLELLDRYWRARVVRGDRRGTAREAVIRIAAEEMVRRRAMRAATNVVTKDPSVGEPLSEVLSANVLCEWQGVGALHPDGAFVAFSHHLLFDYGVARLLLRIEADDLIRKLEQEPDLVLALRPSVLLHFHYLWEADLTRTTFWDLVEKFQRSDQLPEIAKTVGPSVAADQIETAADFEPVVSRIGGTDGR